MNTLTPLILNKATLQPVSLSFRANQVAMPVSQPDSFKKVRSEKYYKALDYLKKVKTQNKEIKLKKLDMNKLEGIQEGIKVFDGLSMKEIYFATRNIDAVLLMRGCLSRCGHCVVDAKPPVSKIKRQKENMIHTMSWEDYNFFLKGYKQLYERIGAFPEKRTDVSHFVDADPINLKSFDKNGKPHNIAEAYKLYYKTTGQPILFDTASWHKKDKWAKQAAKELRDFAVEKPEAFYQINISINPFHGILLKSNEQKKKGNLESAEKLRNKYTDRIADAILTFFPLFIKGKGTLIIRALDNNNKNKGFTYKDQLSLNDEILSKVVKKIDFNSPDTAKGWKNLLKEFKEGKKYSKTYYKGRAVQYAPFFEKLESKLEDKLKGYFEFKRIKMDMLNGSTVIDANGKVFFGDFDFCYDTDIQLNFKNKDKKTAPLAIRHKRMHVNEKDIDNFLKKLKKPSKPEWCSKLY